MSDGKTGLGNRLSAMTTPLASIFGSGFLVIVSVLGGNFGRWSLVAMAAVCAVAYAVGTVIRFNIRNAEPGVEGDDPPRALQFGSTAAQIALIPAYVISVTLYIRILSSYALGLFGAKGDLPEKAVTTGILGLILLLALTRGLDGLEKSEKWALGATMAIIVLIVGAFGIHDAGVIANDALVLTPLPSTSIWHMATILAGGLIVVQGFEPTRYLGDEFDADTRVRAARDAQLVATIVYLLFIASATPLMHLLPASPPDNALMHLAGHVAAWLTVPLVMVAVFSQFSAAIADAISAAGSMAEVSHRHIGSRLAYILICGAAVALCWAATTMSILALASRAFAAFYLIQCLIAIGVTDSWWRRAGFGVVAAVLAFVTCFAVPVG